jgi:hypothetical protein
MGARTLIDNKNRKESSWPIHVSVHLFSEHRSTPF